ncbi:MAG: SPOR domain-containing protein [Gemmatimonadota bacterium]
MTSHIGKMAAALALSCIAALPLCAQSSEVSLRVERLTASGNSAAARVVIDSVLSAAPEGSVDYVEALYWHAVLDSTAAGAERDYLRLVVEYPLSPRASAALLRLSQLELARLARDRARRHLEKLRTDYPDSEHLARANHMAAKMELEDGSPQKACALLEAARAAVAADEVELRNQIVYLHTSCGARAVPPVSDSTTSRSDSTVRRGAGDSRPAAAERFSIQVAAYNTQREATTLARQLQRRGVAARVVGTSAPFRVRIGRYATREEARRAMTQAGLRGIIVEAEPA